MMMIRMRIIFSIILLTASCYSQSQNIPFSYTYGGSGNDGGYGVVEASDSGYVVCGQTGSFSYGASDMYLFKTDVNGTLLWRKHFGGTNSEGARSIVNAHGGGYLISGYTNSFGSGGYDYYVVRTDENGDSLWTKSFGGNDWDFAYASCTTSNGNYVIAGESYSFGNGKEIFLLHMDDSGNLVDSLVWGGPGDQTVGDVFEYEAGKLIFAGSSVLPGQPLNQYIVGYDYVNQTLIFENVVSAQGNQVAYAVQPTPSGGFATFGYHELSNGIEMLTGIFNADGSHVGNTILFIPGEDLKLFTSKRYGNEFVTGGYRKQVNSNSHLPTFYRLDQFGNFLEGGALGSFAYNATNHIILVSGGGVVMTGLMEGYGPGPSSALLWKLDSNLAGSGNPSPVLSVSESGDSEIPLTLNIYPNPLQKWLNVKLPNDEIIDRVHLIDIQGHTIPLSMHAEGVYPIPELASGVYILEVQLQNGKLHREKMIKIP